LPISTAQRAFTEREKFSWFPSWEHDLTAYGPGLGPVVDYSLTITKQQATNVSDAVQLLGLVFPNKAAAGNPGDHPNYWACSTVPVAYKTSTIKVSLSYTAANNSPYTASQTFVNEAKNTGMYPSLYLSRRRALSNTTPRPTRLPHRRSTSQRSMRSSISIPTLST